MSDRDTARALLRAWLDRTRPPEPEPPFAVDPPGEPEPWWPSAPGPQPWSGGVTPGFVAPRPDADPATVADLRALAEGVRRALAAAGARLDAAEAAVRAARAECWELANWLLRVETGTTAGAAHGDRGEGQGPRGATGAAASPGETWRGGAALEGAARDRALCPDGDHRA